MNKKFVKPVNSGKKIGKIDRTFFVLSNFYLFLEELTHKNWPNKKFVEPVSSGKKIGKIDRTLFVFSNFYLFLEELAHKNWPNKKFIEPFRPGRKIENSKKSGFLLFWEFIFFPKAWLIRTGLDKKFIDSQK
ncbi:hypothetical protein BFC23_01220 [Carnobacterium maltaromaticum]|nr:hypothetical protein BFC23_01220 [Carnobacterium maltaromaticum]